jgi:hypothetical protein
MLSPKDVEKGFPQGCLVEANADFKTDNVGDFKHFKKGDILKIVNIDQESDLCVYRINSPQWKTCSWVKTNKVENKLKRVQDQFLEDLASGIESQYCVANNIWVKAMKKFKDMEKYNTRGGLKTFPVHCSVVPPNWYLNLSENEKTIIKELVANAETENIDLENIFMFYTSATLKDAEDFLKWWFHCQHDQQSNNTIDKEKKN